MLSRAAPILFLYMHVGVRTRTAAAAAAAGAWALRQQQLESWQLSSYLVSVLRIDIVKVRSTDKVDP
jgi:predicted metal-binding membrane protein